MTKNERIIKYDIRFNPMSSEIARDLLKAIEMNVSIRKMEFANNVDYELRDTLDSVLRKRGKGKKGVRHVKKKK